ncbi:MAG TPA: phenylacetate--CoA ligase family protein [Gammaproteobacteria bacterium]|nr:phenylacetate--CoA ligase family protein [Gammaproteobacteria bacterium]
MPAMQPTSHIPIPKSALQGLVWPAIPEINGNILLTLLFQLEQSQWWPLERLRAAQFRQADSLLRHAFATTPYYAKRLGEAGYNPDTACNDENWLKLPLLKRGDIQQAGAQLASTALPKGHGKTNNIVTSGSTGTPVKLLGSGLTGVFWNLFTVRDFFWRRCDVSGTLAAIRYDRTGVAPYPKGAALPNWGAGFASALPTGTAHFLSIETPIAEQAEWLQRQNVDYLITHPSNLEALIRHCAEAGIKLPSLREVETLSELVPPYLRELCQEQWNIPLVDMYTTQEAGYLALQCPDHTHYHIQSEHVILEILDENGRPCAAGETGRVVLTDLHNFATPLIRYDIGDYAEVGAPCDCGRGLPVINRIFGRQRNMIQLPDGTNHWPILSHDKFIEIAPIKQFQFVQKTLEIIELKLVTERPLSAEEETQLKELITPRLGYAFDLRLTYHEHIPRSSSGKFEDFRCEIKT